ncbi:MAG: hypothetical protein KAV87_20875 [Desulfobacteraceae bacterium]|nr:hypothetical protein [Desulfobacteraceae bacterium]
MLSEELNEDTYGFADHAEEVLFAALKDRKRARDVLHEMFRPFAGTEVYVIKTKTRKETEDQRCRIRQRFNAGPLRGDYQGVANAEGVSIKTVRRVVDGKK